MVLHELKEILARNNRELTYHSNQMKKDKNPDFIKAWHQGAHHALKRQNVVLRQLVERLEKGLSRPSA